MNKLRLFLENDRIPGFHTLFYRNLFARIGVFYYFSQEGIFMGVWSSFLPGIEKHLKLTDSQLGTAVLFVYLGTVLASPFTAAFLRNLGSKWTTFIGGSSYGISLTMIGLAESLPVLIATMFAYGFTMGIMDISMNSLALLTEIIAEKPLFGSFHGSYSVSAAVGSVIGGAFVGTHWPMLSIFIGYSLVAVAGSIMACLFSYSYFQEKHITAFSNAKAAEDSSDVNNNNNGDPFVRAPDTLLRIKDFSSDDNNSRNLSHSNGGSSTGSYLHSRNGCDSVDIHRSSDYSSNSSNVSSDFSDSKYSEVLLPKPIRRQMTNDGRTNNNNNNYDSEDALLVNPLRHSGEWFADSSPASSSIPASSRFALAMFCCVGFCGAFGESSIATWSTVYYNRFLHTSAVVQSLGFMSFMICMAIGRFLCDYLRTVIGRRWIVRIGGLLACLGLTLVVLSLDLPFSIVFACIGFATTGLGLSTLVPIVFSSAGHIPGVHAGSAIALAAMMTYSGSIVSSPLVGLLSDVFGSLRWAMLFDAAVMSLIIPFSWGIPDEEEIYMPVNRQEKSDDEDSKVAFKN